MVFQSLKARQDTNKNVPVQQKGDSSYLRSYSHWTHILPPKKNFMKDENLWTERIAWGY